MHFRAAVKKARFWWKEPRLGNLHSEKVRDRVLEHAPGVRVVTLTDDPVDAEPPPFRFELATVSSRQALALHAATLVNVPFAWHVAAPPPL